MLCMTIRTSKSKLCVSMECFEIGNILFRTFLSIFTFKLLKVPIKIRNALQYCVNRAVGFVYLYVFISRSEDGLCYGMNDQF
jgi:hypothetical protein